MNTCGHTNEARRALEGYPRAYYWRVRAGQAWAILFLIGLGIVTGFVVYRAVYGPDGGLGPASVMFAVFLFCIWALAGNVRAKHGVVHLVPYFTCRVGGTDTFQQGIHLARYGAYLDRLAVAEGLRPISAFGFRDNFFFGFSLPIPIFHDPMQGLQTVCGLMALLRRDHPGDVDLAGAYDDLEMVGAKLEMAVKQGVHFCFHLRMNDAWISLAEMDNRKGSYQ
jgi:hypothetical protein